MKSIGYRVDLDGKEGYYTFRRMSSEAIKSEAKRIYPLASVAVTKSGLDKNQTREANARLIDNR